jgi:CheY-like chemotaxis protein
VSGEAVFLVVEDNQDDVLLLRKAFECNRILNPLQVVTNGADAMSYLEGAGRFRNRAEFPLPKIVLLDLKLPGISGFEVLQWIRQQPGLAALRDIRDVNRAYELGANSFLVKPNELDDLCHLAAAIRGYWLWVSKAPDSFRPGQSMPRKLSPKPATETGELITEMKF